MKKISLIFAIMLIYSIANSQFLIGNYAMFSYKQQTDYSETELSGVPTFGFFVKKNSVVGVELDFSFINKRWENATYILNNNHKYCVKPFFRQYFKNSVFVSGGFNIAKNTSITQFYNYYIDPITFETVKAKNFQNHIRESKYKGVFFNIGYAIEINRLFSIEPKFEYNIGSIDKIIQHDYNFKIGVICKIK